MTQAPKARSVAMTYGPSPITEINQWSLQKIDNGYVAERTMPFIECIHEVRKHSKQVECFNPFLLDDVGMHRGKSFMDKLDYPVTIEV